jgi:hypothetical protein
VSGVYRASKQSPRPPCEFPKATIAIADFTKATNVYSGLIRPQRAACFVEGAKHGRYVCNWFMCKYTSLNLCCGGHQESRTVLHLQVLRHSWEETATEYIVANICTGPNYLTISVP